MASRKFMVLPTLLLVKGLSGTEAREPMIPDGWRVYAVGDVHGRADLLMTSFRSVDMDLVLRPTTEHVIVVLGDIIDRGPSTCTVVGELLRRHRMRQLICLMGNHELALIRFLEKPEQLPQWLAIGGAATLRSYDVSVPTYITPASCERTAMDVLTTLPPDHLQFLRTLPLYYMKGDYLFVHAGLRPGRCLLRQTEDDLTGIRSKFLRCTTWHGHMVVHGHTPVFEPDTRHNRINIDTGAYATGRLTCLRLEETDVRFLSTTERSGYDYLHATDAFASRTMHPSSQRTQGAA